MKSLIAYLLKLLLKTRYRVTFRSEIRDRSLKSTLILPNHPAEIDPVIVSTYLWPLAKPRPVVLETIFEMPVLSNLFRSIGAIAMPDMEQGSGFYKRKRIKDTLDNVVSALNSGDNILIYPSGRLSVDGKETLGGASGAYTILQRLETGRIMLVRSSGLWGSRFSKAQTGGLRPEIGAAFLSSLKTILYNFIFFVPKRPVELVIEEFSLQELRSKSLTDLNSFLENWYARDLSEDPLLISDSFLSKDTPQLQTTIKADETPIVLEEGKHNKIFGHLAKISDKPLSDISQTLRLSEDLGLDSLAIAELVTWLHDEFECVDLELAELINVNSVLRAAARDPSAKVSGDTPTTPAAWTDSIPMRLEPMLPEATSLAEAFLFSVKRNKSMPACADPRLGIKSYQDLLVASLVLRNHLAKLPGQNIGILLPASGMSALLTFAILLARKTPVFLNWTAGVRALEHSVKLLSINNIVTAGAVLDTINQDLSILENKFFLLEELKLKTSLAMKLKAFFQALLPAAQLIKALKLKEISENDTAAVLFTSGSEAAPKGVPLSNRNILGNIRSICSAFEFKHDDVVYGFLPPFHSFGLTVTTLMPILCGIRVSFHANPNESRKIAKGCATWQISTMAGTPSFIRGILTAGDPEAFSSLRIIMSGADRLSDDIRELCRHQAPEALLLEGYGITECSPVVCAQRPGSNSQGVGPALPQVQLKIVDLNSMKQLKEGERGLVLISGPNVFPGYIGEANNPFVELDGIKWYNSGDLGFISDGSLILAGRLKRFVKIGGEMISLPAIEDALIKNLSDKVEVPILAIIDSEDSETNRPLLTVFSNQAGLSKEKGQEILKEAGFPDLVKLHEVRYLEELPMLGTGKIDIQSLKKMLKPRLSH